MSDTGHITMRGGARWYVVQTRHLSENRAAQELANQAFEIFLPRYRRSRRHARTVTSVAAPLFPRCLFVRFNPTRQLWRSINGAFGMVRLVAGKNGPLPLPDPVIESLRAGMDADSHIALAQRTAFPSGQVVRIIAGSFAERLGLFEHFRDQERVAILLKLMGSKVRVLLDKGMVDKAA